MLSTQSRACARSSSVPLTGSCLHVIYMLLSVQNTYIRSKFRTHESTYVSETPYASYVVIIAVIITFKSICLSWPRKISTVIVSFDKSRLIMR
jgi:hypothetical protein